MVVPPLSRTNPPTPATHELPTALPSKYNFIAPKGGWIHLGLGVLQRIAGEEKATSFQLLKIVAIGISLNYGKGTNHDATVNLTLSINYFKFKFLSLNCRSIICPCYLKTQLPYKPNKQKCLPWDYHLLSPQRQGSLSRQSIRRSELLTQLSILVQFAKIAK